MKFDSHIIYKPRSQPALRRGLFGAVTLVFWIVYAYLWLPLVTLVLWLLGVRTALFELYLRDHQIEPFLLASLPVLALASAAVLIVWAEYNRYRFGDRERRAAQSEVTPDEVAHAVGGTPQLAQDLSRTKVAVLRMDDAARPMGLSEAVALR